MGKENTDFRKKHFENFLLKNHLKTSNCTQSVVRDYANRLFQNRRITYKPRRIAAVAVLIYIFISLLPSLVFQVHCISVFEDLKKEISYFKLV